MGVPREASPKRLTRTAYRVDPSWTRVRSDCGRLAGPLGQACCFDVPDHDPRQRAQRPASPMAGSTPSRSRRDFMKKAAVVGTAVWAVPVIQSTVAPAAAASGTVCSSPDGTCGTLVLGPGPCVPCSIGVACGTDTDCATRVGCASRSGSTVCGGPGATCRNDSHCLYSNCRSGTCGYGATSQAASCGTPTDQAANGPANDDACETGWYCKPRVVDGDSGFRCRSTTP